MCGRITRIVAGVLVASTLLAGEWLQEPSRPPIRGNVAAVRGSKPSPARTSSSPRRCRSRCCRRSGHWAGPSDPRTREQRGERRLASGTASRPQVLHPSGITLYCRRSCALQVVCCDRVSANIRSRVCSLLPTMAAHGRSPLLRCPLSPMRNRISCAVCLRASFCLGMSLCLGFFLGLPPPLLLPPRLSSARSVVARCVAGELPPQKIGAMYCCGPRCGP